jgi:hypothetical protein
VLSLVGAGADMGVATVDHQCVKTDDQVVAAGHSVEPACRQEAFEDLMDRTATAGVPSRFRDLAVPAAEVESLRAR